MSRYEILETIQDLSSSQGFYGRLLETILNDEEDNILDYLESQNFKDAVDMVMFIEG